MSLTNDKEDRAPWKLLALLNTVGSMGMFLALTAMHSPNTIFLIVFTLLPLWGVGLAGTFCWAVLIPAMEKLGVFTSPQMKSQESIDTTHHLN